MLPGSGARALLWTWLSSGSGGLPAICSVLWWRGGMAPRCSCASAWPTLWLPQLPLPRLPRCSLRHPLVLTPARRGSAPLPSPPRPRPALPLPPGCSLAPVSPCSSASVGGLPWVSLALSSCRHPTPRQRCAVPPCPHRPVPPRCPMPWFPCGPPLVPCAPAPPAPVAPLAALQGSPPPALAPSGAVTPAAAAATLLEARAGAGWSLPLRPAGVGRPARCSLLCAHPGPLLGPGPAPAGRAAVSQPRGTAARHAAYRCGGDRGAASALWQPSGASRRRRHCAWTAGSDAAKDAGLAAPG